MQSQLNKTGFSEKQISISHNTLHTQFSKKSFIKFNHALTTSSCVALFFIHGNSQHFKPHKLFNPHFLPPQNPHFKIHLKQHQTHIPISQNFIFSLPITLRRHKVSNLGALRPTQQPPQLPEEEAPP